MNSSKKLLYQERKLFENSLVVGNRIPYHFFITSGIGESDESFHTGSFHLALTQAGIGKCNIINYSSILPKIAEEVEKPKDLIHGSVLETIMARCDVEQGERATAGLIIGWLYNAEGKQGGLVCEYSGNDDEEAARESLERRIEEVYKSEFSENFELRNLKIVTRSFVPRKRYGTALVAICFLDYLIPILK